MFYKNNDYFSIHKTNMNTINNIEDAQNFIYNYDLFKSKAENQEILFNVLKKCEQLASESNNKVLLCQTRIFLTNYYIQINDLENALHIGLENKKYSEVENLEEENLKTYSGLIEIYLSLGDYAKLEELIIDYKEKLINKNDYSKLCSLYIISGIQFNNLKDFKNSLESNQKAIEYAKLSKNINLMIYAYNNLGYQFLDNDIQISKNALENALDIIKNHQKDISLYSKAIVELNSSRLYLKLNNYPLSNKLIKSSIKRLTEINNNNELNSAKLVQSELYIETNKPKSALLLLNEIERNCIEHKNKPILLTCYQRYIQLYEKKKKYKETLEYYKKYYAVNEEIYNEESNKKIRNLQILNEVNTIKKQRDHAEAIANIKHDFLANMSHEIRTPINSILGICYLLQQDVLNPKQTNYIQRLQLSGENLLSLINDILDISKIEADKMELVPVKFNIQTFLQNIYQQFTYKADEKKLNFTLKTSTELNFFVEGDSNRLSQVLLNLLSNALKFTKEGTIALESTILKQIDDNTLIQFTITDTGIGISNDKINKIFQRYEQAAADIKTQFGGTGLGLSITKKIIELMNGTIEVNSVLNEGTTFIVKIPFNTINNIKPETEQKITKTNFLTSKRILIADDNIESRLVMRDILLTFNDKINIDEVSNGEEAVQKVNSHTYDLVLMDLDMPVKNGIEATIEILKIQKYRHLKIIAHTASLLAMNKDELLKMGFVDLLQKPFTPVDLFNKLKSALQKNTE